MKKLILVFLIIFGLYVNLFGADFNSFIGKRVKIETVYNYTYIGIVRSVLDMEICQQKDKFNNCIFEKHYYTLFLEEKEGMTTISCEIIDNIKEI